MKKVLVIGGSGFIGSHVADSLSNAGYHVTIYDQIKSNWLRSDQKMVVGDVQDGEKLHHIIAGVEVVYNFAALADLNQALDKPLQTASINIIGNLNVLEACVAHRVKRFIFASTVYVHSREGGFYRCSKQASEAYVQEYQRVHGLDFTILRYGSLYGPRADERNGLYRIVKSAIDTGKIVYEGNADSMREYIHVDDAARASVDALSEEFKNASVILTGQEPMKVFDLLRMLAEIMNLSNRDIKFIEGDITGHYVTTPYSYQPKLDRKYTPTMHVDLGQGLLQVINEISNSIRT